MFGGIASSLPGIHSSHKVSSNSLLITRESCSELQTSLSCMRFHTCKYLKLVPSVSQSIQLTYILFVANLLDCRLKAMGFSLAKNLLVAYELTSLADFSNLYGLALSHVGVEPKIGGNPPQITH